MVLRTCMAIGCTVEFPSQFWLYVSFYLPIPAGFHPVGEVEGKLPPQNTQLLPQKERERKRKGEGERERGRGGKCGCFGGYDILVHFKTC